MKRLARLSPGLALLALVLSAASLLGQGAALQIGPGDARELQLVSDGKPYYSLSPLGVLANLNGATFGGTIGVSEDVVHNSEWFTTTGDKSWTVLTSDVISNNITSIGKLRLISLDIQGSDIGAGTTGNAISIQLPFIAKKRAVVPAVIVNNSVSSSDARCLLGAGSSAVLCTLNSGVVFTTGTGVFGIRFQMAAEVS